MTTGYWFTGPWNNGTEHIHAAKSWSGGDGKTIEDRYTYKPKWNSYEMAHARFHSNNPNKLGYIDKATNEYRTVDNHDFYAIYGPLGAPGWIYQAFPSSLFNEYWTDREETALLAKLLKKVRGHDLDLGVALAEVDKLATSVVDTLKNLVYGVNDLSEGNFARFAQRFGTSPPNERRTKKLRTSDIPGRFLEMRYCWEPTINDAFEAATAFEQISSGPRQSVFKAGKKRVEEVYDRRTNYDIVVPTTIEVRRSYIFEQYEEMAFARQLGLLNPATVLWERVPFSFVCDWFLPIGNYLNLIGQIPFMKGRWCRTSSIRQTARGNLFSMPETASNAPALPYVDCDSNRFNLKRDTDFPFPPGVPIPSFRVHGAIQGKRVMNAIALASSFFLKAGTNKDLGNYVPDFNLWK